MKIAKSAAVPAALAVIFMAGILAGRLSAPRSAPATPAVPSAVTPTAPPSPPAALLATIPDVRQSTNYSCGAAALQAVLAHWGISEREDRLMTRLHTTPEKGTSPDNIVRGAREFGLQAELREGLGLADLEAGLAAGFTVIVDLQARREAVGRPWTELWDDGHYMVLLGMDDRNLYFEDPSLLGSRGYIARQEFLDRWHDYEGDEPLDASDRKYVHAAIFIRGQRPADPLPLAPVE